jgi:hypothetical protein
MHATRPVAVKIDLSIGKMLFIPVFMVVPEMMPIFGNYIPTNIT